MAGVHSERMSLRKIFWPRIEDEASAKRVTRTWGRVYCLTILVGVIAIGFAGGSVFVNALYSLLPSMVVWETWKNMSKNGAIIILSLSLFLFFTPFSPLAVVSPLADSHARRLMRQEEGQFFILQRVILFSAALIPLIASIQMVRGTSSYSKYHQRKTIASTGP